MFVRNIDTGFKICTANTDSQFEREVSSISLILDSKLKRVTKWRTLKDRQRKMI